jgi:hypothetical protein
MTREEYKRHRRYEYACNLGFVVHNIITLYVRKNEPIPYGYKKLKKDLWNANKLPEAELDKLISKALHYIALEGRTDKDATLTMGEMLSPITREIIEINREKEREMERTGVSPVEELRRKLRRLAEDTIGREELLRLFPSSSGEER